MGTVTVQVEQPIPVSKNEEPILRAMASNDECKAGRYKCPFYSTVSATFKFCKLRGGRDCPCGGMVDIPTTDTKEYYKAALLRILKAWDERHERTQSDFHAAMDMAATVLGFEFKGNSWSD